MNSIQPPTCYPFISPLIGEKIVKHFPRDVKDSSGKGSSEEAFSAWTNTERLIFFLPRFNVATAVIESPLKVYDASNPLGLKLLLSRNAKHKAEVSIEATTCLGNMKFTDLFFRKIFGRNPVMNSSGNLMKSYINFDEIEIFRGTGLEIYNNASWVPRLGAVIFGIMDKRVFNPFVLNQDITLHEFGHAVTQSTANFQYFSQSGALNESMSDVFAIMGKHYKNGSQSHLANWNIADGVIVRNDPENGTAQRSMSCPGQAYVNHPILESDQQVKHMNSYRDLPIDEDHDWGGVHLNSGIPNHAFYLASIGIVGNSWEKPGHIWYNALLAGKPTDDFLTFAHRTLVATKELKYNEGIYQIVAKAWTDVGVDLRSYSTTTYSSAATKNPVFSTIINCLRQGLANLPDDGFSLDLEHLSDFPSAMLY